MKLNIKKLCQDAVVPMYAHPTDAGLDLTAVSKSYDENGNVVYGTGLAVEIPEGHVGLLFPRSSNAKRSLLLSNSVGVIDSGYRGEILFKFRKTYVSELGRVFHDRDAEYQVGDRIGQLIVIRYEPLECAEVDTLSDSERGEGGYGSSGR